MTTCTTLLVGVPIAYMMSRYNVFGKNFIHIFIIMSLMSPPFIGAYSWIMLFGRAGFVTKLFANIGIHLPSIYGKLGIILVFTFKLFPYVYLYTSGAMGSIDSSIEEAAENLGSNKLRRLLTITLPGTAHGSRTLRFPDRFPHGSRTGLRFYRKSRIPPKSWKLPLVLSPTSSDNKTCIM